MSDTLAAVAAHLWQSTLVLGLAWMATLALRTNRPRVRYWLWVAASVKFLLPFSWLVSLGAQFEWRTALPITQPAAAFVMEEILAPPVVLASAAPAPQPAQPVAAALSWVLVSVWALGFVVVLFWWWRQSRPLRAALRDATPIELAPGHDVRDLVMWSSASMIEPGVVGIWRPVLLLPDGLTERLTSAQLKAVIAHERCHIRCRDNLAAALHMLVEALFWFHPGVWWLERRLVAERERACDEAVLVGGNDPADYADGILTVCRFTVAAPLACVTGVSGSDLRARIESIVRNERGAHLSLSRRLAVAFCGLLLLGVPIVTGVVTAIPLLAVGQEPATPVFFEVAVVRPNKSGERSANFGDRPGGRFEATNTPLHMLILDAYRISEKQLVDAPEWTRNERFDVNARLEQEAPIVRGGESGERQLALRSLLAQRFRLAVHRETRQVPMYALVMARADRKPGPRLKPSATDCSARAVQERIAAAGAGQTVAGMCGRRVNAGRIQFGGYPLSEFVRAFQYGGRSVIDRTGLTGAWDFELTFTPDRMELQPGQEPPPVDPDSPSLPAALQEQLGLRLEPITGTIEVLVVDRVERLDAQDALPIAAAVTRATAQPAPALESRQSAAGPVSFEAASLRLNVSRSQDYGINRMPGGRLVATNAPLARLITWAYGLQPFQLQGGPEWLTDRFDIVARVEGNPREVAPGSGPDVFMLAMQNLLAERFRLQVHRATRDGTIYALVLARADGRLGPQLTRSSIDCVAQLAQPNVVPAEACGLRANDGRLRMRGLPLQALATGLTAQLQRTVIDRTNLTGAWDFELKFSKQDPPPPDSDAPALFTALQEQLGLRLDSTKGPIDMLVIDRLERPSVD